MKSPRNIVVKTLFNPDEYLAFNAECVAADVSHSKALRDLAKGYVSQQRNVNRGSDRKEWPGSGQNMAMFLPSRANYGAKMQMNMRV